MSYGWRPDPPDPRDHRFVPTVREPYDRVDLRAQLPPVWSQGQLHSCSAQALAAAIDYQLTLQGDPGFTPSRLFVYYVERARQGTADSDAGSGLRNGIKAVNAEGACAEADWPYDEATFRCRPPDEAYARARLHRALAYRRVAREGPDPAAALRSALSEGRPVAFGFQVYESFESDEVARTGQVPLPGPGERIVEGHAVLAVGYEPRDSGLVFLCRNSWGPDWGDRGYFTLPAGYLTSHSLASDFWTVTTVG